ncbi:MAG: hypothetical protein JHC93_03795 [Parachlamydiales bacterium]|nr:hypothetical protein [Parachlamydiales bacterium]
MKIYGDNVSSFTVHGQEKTHFGKRDLLKGQQVTSFGFSPTNNKNYSVTYTPTIHVHIIKDIPSLISYDLKKLMTWRWKSIYLDPQDGSQIFAALISTKIDHSCVPDSIQRMYNKDFLTATLMNKGCYEKFYSKEYLFLNGTEVLPHLFCHKFGQRFASTMVCNSNQYFHVHRKRGLISRITYLIKKIFNPEWKEATVKLSTLHEKVLVKSKDYNQLKKLSAIGLEVI